MSKAETTRNPSPADKQAFKNLLLKIVWPEIQEMLMAVPKRTLNDLHEWLKPFMRAGIMPYLELETLRDICEPPPRGIGISLRPLKSRQK